MKESAEVFTNTGRAGMPIPVEATARLVSIALRSGIDAESIIEQLKESAVLQLYASVI